MTRTEKDLAKALEALNRIATGDYGQGGRGNEYAAKVYAELTAPRTEQVEVVVWVVEYNGKRVFHETKPTFDESVGCRVVKLTGTYSRPVIKASCCRIVVEDDNGDNGVICLPHEWIGRRVVIEPIIEEGE